MLRYKLTFYASKKLWEFMHRVFIGRFMMFSAVYAAICLVLAWTIHPNGFDFVIGMSSASQDHWKRLWRFMPEICVGVLIFLAVSRFYLNKDRLTDFLFAFAGCAMFMWGFSLFKSTMPFIVPFWADPLFKDIDALLHFGYQPWQLVEPLRAPIGTEMLDYIYMKFWAWPALVGPLLLVIFDQSRERVARYLLLFVFCWIGLGSVLAMIFMSAGPVYYDRMLGTQEFSGLMAILEAPEQKASLMGIVRDWLWAVNFEGHTGLSSGISAFPSVHVGIATVTCLYLCERSRYLAPIGIGFLAFILLGSVLSGLHYAVDGYASLVLVIAAWAILRKKAAVFAMARQDDPDPGFETSEAA